MKTSFVADLSTLDELKDDHEEQRLTIQKIDTAFKKLQIDKKAFGSLK